MSTTTANTNWQDESSIKQAEFAGGYWQESDRRTPVTDGSRDRKNDAGDLQHTHAQTVASETTFYADDDDWQGGGDPWPFERFDKKRDRMARLWRYNAGHDHHRINGKSREDCHKVDESAEYKRRLTETVCNQAELSDVATARATSLTAREQPPRFNFIGGLRLWILAAVVVAAEDHGEVGRLDHLCPGELGEDWIPTVNDLDAAVDAMDGKCEV